jgi:hypothetical protein
MSYTENKINENKVRMLGSKVLLKAVSFIEEAKTTLTMLDIHKETDANALYYRVIAMGPDVKEVKIGDKIQHVDAAADKLDSNKFCIVDEKYIRMIFED